MLDRIVRQYAEAPLVQSLTERIKNGYPLSLEGLWGSAGRVLIAALAGNLLPHRRHLCLVAADEEQYSILADEMQELARCIPVPGLRTVYFPEYGRLPYEQPPRSSPAANLRQECLEQMLSDQPVLLVTTIRALFEHLPSPGQLQSYKIYLFTGQSFDFIYLSELLTDSGYERQDMVDQVGTFAVRGGIVDVYPYGNENPVRIEFDGNEILSIRSFDLLTQRSVAPLASVTIYPKAADESGSKGGEAMLTDYLDATACGFIFEPDLVYSRAEEYWTLIQEQYTIRKKTDPNLPAPETFYHSLTAVQQAFQKLSHVHFCGISRRIFEVWTFHTVRAEEFSGNINRLRESLCELTAKKWQSYILCDNRGQAERLDDLLESDALEPGRDYRIGVGELHEGFYDSDEKLAIFTDHQIFGRYRHPRPVRRFKSVQALRHIRSLKPGDLVVHVDHGIGRYAGLETVVSGDHREECLKILYQGGDKLFVPLEHFARVQKFSGEEGVEPKLNKLGSAEWERVKNRTRKSIRDIAQDLIQLYARRKATRGFAFSPDTTLQLAMESSFEFEDTPDQEKVTEEIKNDMESETPMDRLVCGDVGFGKTEVAIRVAFKAVQDSKQVAVLVPTTILAEQHYLTFTRRLREFPVTVEVISRFKTKKEQTVILRKLEEGKIDILIGTHRLLSDDVRFKDLGLLIIDEEQRFGVTHKEKIKKMKASVDTLTLTATPIPRTLHFSLMGGRDLSRITTPPHDRLPIKTEILQFDEDRIRDAIMREIHRGGQVYYVHNRVESIDSVAVTLKTIVPKARFGIIHGQMAPQRVEEVIHRFLQKEFDVLVATTIIENGIDIPNVNTIILDQAHQYGLAQLYQLRGRVGRSSQQAYCYLLTPGFSALPEDAVRRLQAIEELTELGSGFILAMRDLEIRGAGNLFGAEQSGFINSIGFELYSQILDETIAELKLEQGMGPENITVPKRELTIKVHSFRDSYIPDDYINVTAERIDFYQRLAKTTDIESLDAIETEITDRFGRPPQETVNLFQTIRLKILSDKLGASELHLTPDYWALVFDENHARNPVLADPFQKLLQMIMTSIPNIRLRQEKGLLEIQFGFPWFDVQKKKRHPAQNQQQENIYPIVAQMLDKLLQHIHIDDK